MAMVNYPYPTDFVEPLPEWPVTYACAQASAAKAAHKDDPYADLYAIAAAGNTFYNYAGQTPCFDLGGNSNSGLDGNGWGVLACNEMCMPFASNPDNSMFSPSTWNEKANSSYCYGAYGEKP